MSSPGLKVFICLNLLFVFASADFQPEKDVMFVLSVRDKPIEDEQIYRFNQNKNCRTVFIIDQSKMFSSFMVTLKIELLILENEDVNLFFVDWGIGAKTFLYPIARRRVDPVGKVLGNFINYLHDTAGLKYDKTSLIGFSLGAHIVGAAGQLYVNQKVRRILGIDPAGPLFDKPEDRLSPEAAVYVECYHTGYIMGIREAICQTDFYFNGGSKQPGCSLESGLDNPLCSHERSNEVLMESLETPKTFYGFRCENLRDALKKSCNGKPGAFINDPDNEARKLKGIFHVKTNEKSPFGRGRED